MSVWRDVDIEALIKSGPNSTKSNNKKIYTFTKNDVLQKNLSFIFPNFRYYYLLQGITDTY